MRKQAIPGFRLELDYELSHIPRKSLGEFIMTGEACPSLNDAGWSAGSCIPAPLSKLWRVSRPVNAPKLKQQIVNNSEFCGHLGVLVKVPMAWLQP